MALNDSFTSVSNDGGMGISTVQLSELKTVVVEELSALSTNLVNLADNLLDFGIMFRDYDSSLYNSWLNISDSIRATAKSFENYNRDLDTGISNYLESILTNSQVYLRATSQMEKNSKSIFDDIANIETDKVNINIEK